MSRSKVKILLLTSFLLPSYTIIMSDVMDNNNTLENKGLGQRIKELVIKNQNAVIIISILIIIACFAILFYFLIYAGKPRQNPGFMSTFSNPSPTATTNQPSNQSAKPTLTPVSTPTSTPTPTRLPLIQGPQTFSVSQKNTQPVIYELWFNTIDPKNTTQTSKVKVKDSVGNVTSVQAVVKTDKAKNSYNLTLSSGSAQDGEWTGSWLINDTYNNNFVITFSSTDDKGNSSSVDFTIR